MTTTWEFTSGGAIAKSNSDLTVTSNPGNGNGGARAADAGAGKSGGQWFIEFTDINDGGFGFGLGFGPSSTDITNNNFPEFRLTGSGGVIVPSGGSYSLGIEPTGAEIMYALDLDLSPPRGWIQIDGTWYGQSGAMGGPPSPGDTDGFPLGSLNLPWFPIVWLQFNTCNVTMKPDSVSPIQTPPGGFEAWDPPAGGSDADGAQISPTGFSIIAGTAAEQVDAPGATITLTASISSSGSVNTQPIDGTAIFEFAVAPVAAEIYSEVNYDSIYGRGDRVANGLITAGQYGWTAVFSQMSDGFDNIWTANGPAASGTTPNAAFWFATVAGETLDIRGFTLIGNDEIDDVDQMWTFRGGTSAGVYSTDPYFATIDAYNPNQLTVFETSYYKTEYVSEPKFYTPYAHYEMVYVTGTRTDVRWANEIWLKIAHSGLDGGDRRPSAAPAKRVTFSYSSHWSWGTGTNITTGQDAMFDGGWEKATGKTRAVPGDVANNANPVTTVGAYWQFQFPRPVKPKHLLLVNYNNQKESYDSGDNPEDYGLWHWEYSETGSVWTAIGGSWSFRENCVYMVAPREPDFALPGDGAYFWRMVLDAGPAFGGGAAVHQIIFDLEDITGLAPPFTIAFTDDTDGVPVTSTIGNPGSPYIVSFSDGSDDKLNLTVDNVPNPVLSIAFTDDGQLDSWSDLYSSMVTQTVVIATGRKVN